MPAGVLLRDPRFWKLVGKVLLTVAIVIGRFLDERSGPDGDLLGDD